MSHPFLVSTTTTTTTTTTSTRTSPAVINNALTSSLNICTWGGESWGRGEGVMRQWLGRLGSKLPSDWEERVEGGCGVVGENDSYKRFPNLHFFPLPIFVFFTFLSPTFLLLPIIIFSPLNNPFYSPISSLFYFLLFFPRSSLFFLFLSSSLSFYPHFSFLLCILFSPFNFLLFYFSFNLFFYSLLFFHHILLPSPSFRSIIVPSSSLSPSLPPPLFTPPQLKTTL